MQGRALVEAVEIKLDPETHVIMLQELVHKLEEALCFFRFPDRWARMDNSEYYATAVEAERGVSYRLMQKKK